MSHLDALECISRVVGMVTNAASEPVRLVVVAGWLEFAFVVFDPNVSHWTTKTPNTTATLLVTRSWNVKMFTYRR
jgi:hypothetical protein